MLSSSSSLQFTQPSNNTQSLLNFVAVENEPNVVGHNSNVNIGSALVRKAHEVAKVLDGGINLITTLAKWIYHIQQNW